MTRNKRYYSFLIIALFAIGACSDYNKFEPYNESLGFDYLNAIKPTGTFAIIDPAMSHTLIASDSILLEVGPNSFVDEYGQQLEENINVVFTHVYKGYQMIAHAFSFELENGNLLHPMAIFRIDAYTDSGNRLQLAHGKHLKIKFPQEQVSIIPEIFAPANFDINKGQDSWELVEPSGSTNKIFTEEWTWKSKDGQIRHSAGYIIQTDLVNWMIMGTHLENTRSSSVEVALPTVFREDNMNVVLMGETSKNIQLLTYEEDRHKFCNSSGVIPEESSLKIVAFSDIIDNNIYISIQEIEPETNVSVTLYPGSYTIDEALEVLSGL